MNKARGMPGECHRGTQRAGIADVLNLTHLKTPVCNREGNEIIRCDGHGHDISTCFSLPSSSFSHCSVNRKVISSQ